MSKEALINKIEALHTEYVEYRNYYIDFEEKTFSESRKSVAERLQDKDFEGDFKQFCKDRIKLADYKTDVPLLYNNLKSYVEAAKLLEFDIPKEVETTISRDKNYTIKQHYVFRGDKPQEVEEGRTEKLLEEANIDSLLKRVKDGK